MPGHFALRDLRTRLAALHDGAANYEGGYALSCGSVRPFIRELDPIIADMEETARAVAHSVREIERLTPYVEAFRREETRADKLAQQIDDTERETRTGAVVLKAAQGLGWPDDGEGALEFLLRRTREVAIEDCGGMPSK
jgi:hypothetical protein